MDEPLIQIVDEQDRPVRGATKAEAWANGLPHRVVRILIHDGNGRVLLQKRSPKKVNSPNRWDQSVSGHVDEGEDYDTAAYRELQEELGITGVTLRPIGGYRSVHVQEDRTHNTFNTVYSLRIDPAQPIHFNPDEVTAVQWFSRPEIIRQMAENPAAFTMGMADIVHRDLLGI